MVSLIFKCCFKRFLNTLMLSDSTILLGKLFQGRIILTKKEYLYEFTLAIFT